MYSFAHISNRILNIFNLGYLCNYVLSPCLPENGEKDFGCYCDNSVKKIIKLL